MKIGLLKKLRRRFVIEGRNNQYRAFDYLEKAGGIFDCSEWGSYEDAVQIRRKWILAEARLNHKNAKSIIS